jgi:hypothetical protein
MALNIASYTELKATVARWLNRGDTELLADIPTMIAIAEEEISAELRAQVTRAALTLDSDEVTLPDDCGQLRVVRFDTATLRHALDITTDVALAGLRRVGTGIPQYAAVVDNTLLLDIEPGDDYTAEITYYDKLVPLSDDNPSNDILTNSARIYLFGALKEAEPFLQHDERIPVWEAKFAKAISDENVRRERAELAAAPVVMRLPTVIG